MGIIVNCDIYDEDKYISNEAWNCLVNETILEIPATLKLVEDVPGLDFREELRQIMCEDPLFLLIKDSQLDIVDEAIKIWQKNGGTSV